MSPNPDYNYLQQTLGNACSDFREKRFARGFSSLREVAKIDSALAAEVEKAEAQYFYMLRFIGTNNAMPDYETAKDEIRSRAEDILVRLTLKITGMSDSGTLGSLVRYAERRPEESLESLVSDYISESERLRTDTAALTDTRRRATLERIASDIFNRIRISYPISDYTGLLENILTDTALPAYDRAAWTAAAGLNMSMDMSRAAIDLLLALHAGADEAVSATAAVWLVLNMDTPLPGFTASDTDVKAYAALPDVARAMNEAHPGDAATVLREWVKSLGTERLTNWFLNEIKPRLNDMGRRFSEKMNDPEAGRNAMTDPDLLTGGNAGNFDALKQFSEAQYKGSDVFMPTLGRLRSFPFFGTLSNWFMPFHTAHSALSEVVDSEGAAIADTVASMPMMCDSDKFALILSMAATPAPMRTQAFEAMTSQIYAASETPEFSEMMKQGAAVSRKALISSIIKNIYRLSHNYSWPEFRPLLTAAPTYNTASALAGDEEIIALADILLAEERYKDAAAYYRHFCSDGEEEADTSVLRNFAYASEKSGDHISAENAYEEILRRKPGDFDAAMHLADINLAEGDGLSAMILLQPFESTHSDDMDYLRKLGAAYMNEGHWEEAVNVWHNIDYHLPEGDRSAKPDLAWALTLAGDYDSAETFFEQAPDDSVNRQRRAVMLWLAGRRGEAAALWAKSSGGPDAQTVLDTPEGRWLTGNAPGGNSLGLLSEMDYYNRFGSSFGPLI